MISLWIYACFASWTRIRLQSLNNEKCSTIIYLDFIEHIGRTAFFINVELNSLRN
jgi:hypothetical protein